MLMRLHKFHGGVVDVEQTDFLSGQREDSEKLVKLAERFNKSMTSGLLESLPVGIVVINKTRQAIYCNGYFRTLASQAGNDLVVGLRPGEALGCIHSAIMPGGCGTSRFCRHCGAARAIIESMDVGGGTEECLMQRRVEGEESSLVLQVTTHSFRFEDHDFILFCALDISHERRVQEVERLLFHKLLNSASGMVMLANLSEDCSGDDFSEYADHIKGAARNLVGMIRNQQVWKAAEENRLKVLPEPVNPSRLLDEVVEKALAGKLESIWKMDVHDFCTEGIITDPELLGLILGMLLENAMEALPHGGKIQLESRHEGDQVIFSISNPGSLDESEKALMFKRSFSTKGSGRGFGLYRARLMTRRYLEGELQFQEKQGMLCFEVRLPAGGILCAGQSSRK